MTRHFGARGAQYQAERARTLIVISLCSIVFFSALSYLLISSNDKPEPAAKYVEVVKDAPIDMVEVLVPIQSIESGRPLEPALFRKETKPKLGLSPRVVKDFEEIRGYYARTLIVAEQPLHSDYITKVRPISPIIQQIPEGYRAVTIRVDQVTGVEGWAQPGAQVDVMWSSKVNGKASITVIVENAKVLSAERVTQADSKPGMPIPSTITLLVSTEDSKRIQLATTAGTIFLTLRGEIGNSKGGLGGTITTDDLLNRNGAEPKGPNCTGRLRTCGRDGKCETLCIKSDGTMVPLDGPLQ